MDCVHRDVDLQTGFCKNCRVIVTDGTAFDKNADYDDVRNINRRKRTKTPLFPDRDSIKLPSYIIDAAEDISDQFKIKGNRDERLVRRRFVCLYYACLIEKAKQEASRDVQISTIMNPILLAEYVKMDPKQISKALTDFSPFRTGYVSPVMSDAGFGLRPCTEIAISNAKGMGIPSDYFPVIHDLIEAVMRESKSELHSRTEQTIAAGAIEALLKIYPCIEVSAKKKCPGNSTVHTVSEIIIRAYNS